MGERSVPSGVARKKTRPRGAARTRARQPIADKVIKKMRRRGGATLADLGPLMVGEEDAEELRRTVAGPERLADHHPGHAAYVSAQNQVSVWVEQLAALPETDRLARRVGQAEEEYLPSGPPMSPITTSYFTCWASFDVCAGLGKETFATITMAVGKAFGMDEELVRVIGLMQDSHMGVYVHEGADAGRICLREMVTDRVCKAICPAGYEGRAGELWYARVLPPPLAGFDEHIVFTTPYVLVEPGQRQWQAYFDRTLPEGPLEERVAAYARHMKWGPTRDYWPEFVFEAYAEHRHEVIFLEGLPDVAESRPHSRVHW